MQTGFLLFRSVKSVQVLRYNHRVEKTAEAPPQAEPAKPAPAPAAAAEAPVASGEKKVVKKKKKKKKKVVVKKTPLSTRMKEAIQGFFRDVIEVLKSFGSPDPATRRMAWIFLFSCFGVIVASAKGIQEYLRYRARVAAVEALRVDTDEQARNMEKLVEKAKEAAHYKYAVIELGQFTVELKTQDQTPPPKGVFNVAQIEIYLECDTKETCDFLQAHLDEVKDKVSETLIDIDRDEIMSLDGKARIKQAIRNRLNPWIGKGSVEKVFFSKLVIS